MRSLWNMTILLATLGAATPAALAADLSDYDQPAPGAIVRTERRVLPPIVRRTIVEQPIIREEVVVPRVVTRRVVSRPVVTRQVVTRPVVVRKIVPRPVFVETQVLRRPPVVEAYRPVSRPRTVVVERDSFEPRWAARRWAGGHSWREGRWDSDRDWREGGWDRGIGSEAW